MRAEISPRAVPVTEREGFLWEKEGKEGSAGTYGKPYLHGNKVNGPLGMLFAIGIKVVPFFFFHQLKQHLPQTSSVHRPKCDSPRTDDLIILRGVFPDQGSSSAFIPNSFPLAAAGGGLLSFERRPDANLSSALVWSPRSRTLFLQAGKTIEPPLGNPVIRRSEQRTFFPPNAMQLRSHFLWRPKLFPHPYRSPFPGWARTSSWNLPFRTRGRCFLPLSLFFQTEVREF